MAQTCTVPDEVVTAMNKFKVSKEHNHALLMKINKATLEVEIDEEVPDITLDDLQEYLPESVPRYILYEYEYIHTDQRKSFPLVFSEYPRFIPTRPAFFYFRRFWRASPHLLCVPIVPLTSLLFRPRCSLLQPAGTQARAGDVVQ
jgi:Cofilin/tropomyosin-type actin-binding protein